MPSSSTSSTTKSPGVLGQSNKNVIFFLNTFSRYVGNDESRGEISKVLGSSAIPLEEAKADVMGVWNMLYKVLV